MASSDVITVIDEEPDHFVFGTYRNTTLLVWKAKATAADVARLGAVTRRVGAQSPLGFSAVHFLCENIGLPDSHARAGLQQLMAEFARELACVSVVVGGDGFWASAVRAMVTGLWQAVPRSFEMRISGSVGEAAAWLCPRHLQRTGTTLDASQLTEALRAAQLRLAHATHAKQF